MKNLKEKKLIDKQIRHLLDIIKEKDEIISNLSKERNRLMYELNY